MIASQDRQYEHVKNAFEIYVKNKTLTGAICGVYQGDKEVYRGVFGYSDHKQTKPLQSDAIFRLASMTKPITATAILRLMEKGLLKLEDPISKYIVGFHHSGVGVLADGEVKFSEDASEITILDCLTHSSGLGSGEVGNYQFLKFPEPNNLKENVLAWNGAFLDFAPKSKCAYSGVVAFEILAYIVEIVSGIPFEEFLRKEIFLPLGMTDTTYRLTEENKSRLVEMSKTAKDGGLEFVDYGYRGFGAFAEGYTGGSAGLFSTLEDYSKFVRMLAGGGEWNGVRILSAESVETMRTVRRSSVWANWGLSVRVVEKQNEWQPLPSGSFGWSGAYGTHFWVEPSTGRSAILLLNKDDVGGSGSPISRAFERLLNN